MARILYAVCGEGMGHAVRSDTVIKELRKRHDVVIAAAERAYPYLRSKYDKVIKLAGNVYVYRNNQVRLFRTVVRLLVNLPWQIVYNINALGPIFRSFKPELVISDFESASHYFAKAYKVPCISLDNIHATTECRTGFRNPMFWKTTIRFLHPRSDYYLIPAFDRIRPKRDDVYLLKPIIREEIMQAEPKDKGFVLVYQTSSTNEMMIPALRQSSRRFRIYGMARSGTEDNLEFKDFSEKEFIKDLSECRYVIINGGFTVISEALYLGKPVLSVPLGKQFEQRYNASAIKKNGYGQHARQVTTQILEAFEKNYPRYKYNISQIKRWDNEGTIELIERIIEKHPGGKKD